MNYTEKQKKCLHSWTMNDAEGEINIPIGETVRSTYLRIWWGCCKCMAEESVSYVMRGGVWRPIIKKRIEEE